MSGGYTYTTVANDPGDGTRITTAFYLDERAIVTLYPGGGGRPFFSVELGDTHVHIGPAPTGEPITAAHVQVFRDLAAHAAALLAQVEHLHAQQPDQPDQPEQSTRSARSGGAAA